MIHELKYIETSQTHEKLWGGFNDLPPGWRPITVQEFARSHMFTYIPTHMEYRQMYDAPVGATWDEKRARPMIHASLFFFIDGTGVALQRLDDEVRYFRFGCEHVMCDGSDEAKRRSMRLSKSMHAMRCLRCGYFYVVDSSD